LMEMFSHASFWKRYGKKSQLKAKNSHEMKRGVYNGRKENMKRVGKS